MLRHTQQGLEHYRDQLDRREHELAQLQAKQHAIEDFEQAHAPVYQRVADLDRRLDRHWTDVVVGAAQAGDPYAYGRDRLEHAYRSLLDRRQTSADDALVERHLGDLERTTLTARPAPRLERTPAQERSSSVRQLGDWPELRHDYQLHRDPGHELGVGL
jgi:hypothetical protein